MKKGGKGKWKTQVVKHHCAPRGPETPPNSHIPWPEQIKAAYKSKVEFSRLEEVTPPRSTKLEEEPMKEEVWSRGLPDDVFCTVLAFLPRSSFVRMRCVCKKWNLMAQNQIFLNDCTRVPSQGPSLFLTSRGGPYWTYEPALNAWTCLPPAFFKPKNSEGACYQVTAAGGRLLFITTAPHYSLMVYNPYNKTQQTLPPMFDMSGNVGLPSASEIHVVGMYVDTVKNYYNILVVDKRCNELSEDCIDSEDDEVELNGICAQIYDSRTRSWEIVQQFDPGYQLSMINAALFANSLHCLTISRQLTSIHVGCSVVDEPAVYAMVPDGWEHLPLRVPTLGQTLVAPHLFSTRGSLMLAAAVPQDGTRNNKFPKWKSIIIWELEMVDNVVYKWVKFTEIDLQGLDSFMVSKGSFIFLSEGDCLYFGSNTGSSLGFMNIHNQSWRLLPSFPGYAYATKFKAFLYEPQFDLVA